MIVIRRTMNPLHPDLKLAVGMLIQGMQATGHSRDEIMSALKTLAPEFVAAQSSDEPESAVEPQRPWLGVERGGQTLKPSHSCEEP